VVDELAFFGSHSRAIAAITQPAYADLLARAIPGLRFLAVTSTDGGATPPRGGRPAFGDSFESLRHDPEPLTSRLPSLAPASVQYTSGTTSRPKAVLWTHENVLWGGRVCASHEALRPDDVHLVYLPLFHTNAQAYSMLATLWAGATAVLQPRFSASRFWEVSQRRGCTWTSMVGFCRQALLSLERPPQHSYRMWGGGQNLPAEPFDVPTIGWYGMTETVSHPVTSDTVGDNPVGTMGRPASEYLVSVRDADGAEVGRGETGELHVGGVRGVSLFLEYLHDPEATAVSFDERGWFRTGDRVTVQDSGYLTFADRSKDMLKVGGENVAASEVERVLLQVPGVREAAVVGRPDPMLTEVPVAFVLADGLEKVVSQAAIEACRGQLADFKVPRQVVVVDELPRSTLNKVAKAVLRQQLVGAQDRVDESGGPSSAS
jgi:crotonobetaine/carnitine-CoA ligase